MTRDQERKERYKRLRNAGFDSTDALAYRDLSSKTIDRLCQYMQDTKKVMQKEIRRIIEMDDPS